MAPSHHNSILMLSIHGYVAAQPKLGLPDTGGQVAFVLELARQFAEMGYEVDVCTRRFEDQPAIEELGPRLRLLRIPCGGREFICKENMHDHMDEFVQNFISESSRLELRYDVINSHYWDAGWAGQRIADVLQIPHVHTPHSLGAWKRRQMRDAGEIVDVNYRFPERISKELRVYQQCDHLIATSIQQADLLTQQYRVEPSKITMIPPGINADRFHPVKPKRIEALRQELRISPHDVYALGRIAPNKGYDLLVRSLPILRKLVPDARLVLAVGADSEADQQRVAKLKEIADACGAAPHIDFRGYVADSELADYYRAAGVFALCSRYEPFGMTAVEAMACGTPTVITIHGGLHSAVDFGIHALYADPKQPGEYAAALAMPLLYPQLRERLAGSGAELAHGRYSWTAIARRTLEALTELQPLDDDAVNTPYAPAVV
jgi:mannosylfructose-phosphate synthase